MAREAFGLAPTDAPSRRVCLSARRSIMTAPNE